MKKKNIQTQKLVDQYAERLIKTIKLEKYNKINLLYKKIFINPQSPKKKLLK